MIVTTTALEETQEEAGGQAERRPGDGPAPRPAVDESTRGGSDDKISVDGTFTLIFLVETK